MVQVARGLEAPVYVTAPRSQPSRLYIVEQTGRILVLDKGKLLKKPFLDIRARVGSAGTEQGLLSMAFHPGYAKNHRYYVDYTDRNGDTRVVEFRSNGLTTKTSTARQLLFVSQPFPNHNGGQLEFGPDGKLYVGMGDGGSADDPRNNGQNPASQLAKLLRTNPLAPRWEVAGYGLRNPWRFSFDRKTGDLVIGDVGQDQVEEVDWRPRGAPPANFGWAHYEGNNEFKDVPLNPPGPVVFPIFTYTHDVGCSVSGGYVYRGKAVPSAAGRYFGGDFCSGAVFSFLIQGGKAVGVRREPFKVSSLSSFGEDARGELYLVSLDGSVYRLTA